jgi:putative spermidine/putrescine transport system ATP-binding protein
VYNPPWTEFVARFIGGHNVFTGRVVSTGPTYTVLHAPDGQRFVVPASAVAVGHDVTFAVRSDKMSLAGAALPLPAGVPAALSNGMAAGRNALQATVRSVAYQGAWVQLSLETSALEECTVTMPDSTFFDKPVAVGSPVVATWAVEDVHLLRDGT